MTTATKSQVDKDREAAAKDSAAIAESEAKFRDTVADAAEKHQAVVEKHTTGGNLAELAWNATKAEDDPVYKNAAGDFRGKLDTAVESIRATGIASDIAGLEAFDAEVFRLIAEEKKANEALAVPDKKAEKSTKEK